VVLADSSADRGNSLKRRNLFKRAISIEPESPEAWAGIARLRKMTQSDAAWLAQAQRIAGSHCRPEVKFRFAMQSGNTSMT